VITRPIDPALLTSKFAELCDCTDARKRLLSPISDATEAGYTRIAVVLGYLSHGGLKGHELVQAICAVTDFAPFVCALHRIVNHDEVTGLTVATVGASLNCLLGRLLTRTVVRSRRLEYCLHAACWLVHLQGIDTMDKPTLSCDGTRDAFGEYLRATGHPPVFIEYVPDADAAKKFMTVDLTLVPDVERIRAICDAFPGMASFKPVLPLSVRECARSAIVQHTKNNVILFLSVDRDDANLITVIDPRRGEARRTDVEDLARLVGFRYEDDLTLLIPAESVSEIIEICIDCSGSMKSTPATSEISVPILGETSRLDYLWQMVASAVWVPDSVPSGLSGVHEHYCVRTAVFTAERRL
jgi:hypothetical protein